MFSIFRVELNYKINCTCQSLTLSSIIFTIMNKTKLSTDFYFALFGFMHQAKLKMLAAAAELDLTGAQAFSLLHMDIAQPRSMKSYCQSYNLDAGNLTGIIDGLEEKGLVVREQDPSDRRIKTIRILPKGLKLRTALMQRIAENSGDLFAPLTASEQAEFATCVEKIHQASLVSYETRK